MKTTAAISSPPGKFQFVGGDLCLDFTNTVGGKRGLAAREYLNSYTDFVSWCRQAGLLDGPKADALLRGAARRPEDSSAVLRRAIALRETIYRIFAALAADEAPAVADLKQLNDELCARIGCLRVVAGRKGFHWAWDESDGAFDQPLGPIAHSAGELLTTPQRLESVRQCEGERCGWLFIDSTKNHSRRWCVMSDCGNVAKVRRFRLKNRRRAVPK